MRRIGLIVLLLIAAPTGQACSIALQSFTHAGFGGDVVTTDLGEDAVAIDLRTGTQTRLAQDFFPHTEVSGDGQHILIKAQQGLGADCSGEVYVTAHGDSFHRRDVLDMDIGGDLVAIAYRDHIDVHRLGTWARVERIAHEVPDTQWGSPGHARVAVHPSGHVAVADEFSVRVHSTLSPTFDFANVRAIEWHGDQLVLAQAEGQSTRLTILRDVFSQPSQGTVTIPADGWPIGIAAGKELFLVVGGEAIKVQGSATWTLRAPAHLTPSAIAASDQGAVILATKGEYGEDSGGIQRWQNNRFTTWHVQDGEQWKTVARPGWSWQGGPAIEWTGGSAHGGEEAPAWAPISALAAIGVALLARRLR